MIVQAPIDPIKDFIEDLMEEPYLTGDPEFLQASKVQDPVQEIRSIDDPIILQHSSVVIEHPFVNPFDLDAKTTATIRIKAIFKGYDVSSPTPSRQSHQATETTLGHISKADD